MKQAETNQCAVQLAPPLGYLPHRGFLSFFTTVSGRRLSVMQMTPVHRNANAVPGNAMDY